MAESTFNPDAHPETSSFDGYTFQNPAGNWTTARSITSAGTLVDSGTTNFLCYIRDNGSAWTGMLKGIHLFDISSIPAGATITDVDFQFYVTAASENHSGLEVTVAGWTTSSDTGLTGTDHDIANAGDRLASDKGVGTYSTSAYNSHTFNATGVAFVQSALDGDGIVRIGTLTSADYDNVEPTKVNATSSVSGHSAENSNKPKLVVTYTEGGGVVAPQFIGYAGL